MGALIAALGAKTTAGAALAQGVTAGATLGKGVAALTPTASGIFSAAQPALAGLPSALAPTAGLPSLLTPTAGIFSKAMPALAGLPSTFTGPGLLNTMGMSPLGGMASMVPAGTSLPGAAGFKSLAMANAPLYGGEAAKLTNLGFKSAQATQLPSNFIKVADTATKTGLDTSLLGQGARFKAAPSLSRTDLLARQAGQVPKTVEAASLAQQADVGQRAIDLARAQKMAAQSGVVSPIQPGENFLSNLGNLIQNPSMDAAGDYIKEHPYATAAAGYGLYQLMKPEYKAPPKEKALIRPYEYAQTQRPEAYATSPLADTSERMYFDTSMTAQTPYTAPGPEYAAEGGLMGYAVGGPIETMAAMNAVGANTGYPMAGINTAMYSNPMMQRPEAVNVISPSGDAGVTAYSGEPKFAEGGELKTVGEYKYSFDPKTNTFTQVGTPRYAESTPTTGYPGFGGGTVAPAVERPALYTGSKTAGGIAAPVGGFGTTPSIPSAQQAYAGPTIPAYQSPEQQLGLSNFYEMMNRRLAEMSDYPGYAQGGLSHLGDYSDGGRLLKGPGDGVSDSIPAVIGKRQPARLADGEFVIPARIVSELGNGSTEAGARKLYAMMDRIQKGRRKSVGKGKVAVDSKSDKHLPA